MNLNVILKITKRLNKIFLKENEIITNSEKIEFWKSNIFSVISFSIIFFGGPTLVYGAYLFFTEGLLELALAELLVYFFICIIVTRKALNIEIRKLFIVLAAYILSITLLVFTGMTGAGMVCVLLSMMLAGTILNKKQINLFVITDLCVFTVLTILLNKDFFVNQDIHNYGELWYINAITTQVCGISILLLIHVMYEGLINQNKRLEESKETISNSEKKHKVMIANISDVIIITDDNGIVKYCSPNMEQKFGWCLKDTLNVSLVNKIYFEDQVKIRELFTKPSWQDGMEVSLEARIRSKNDEVKYLDFTAVNMKKDSNIQGILITFHDITERRIREDKIKFLYERDKLTGLYNRQYIDNIMSLLDMENYLPISAIYADLNGLKIINDALGYEEGDKFLIAVAKILNDCVRKEDILSRAGGDEFLIILPNTDKRTAEVIVEKIYEKCKTFNESILDELFFLSISLGCSTKEKQGESLEKTIKNAEDGMYKKKILEEKSIHNSILMSMQRVLFEKSQETEAHALRLVKMSKKIGIIMKLTNQQIDELELVAKLHDIGKIGIDERILEKPQKLSDEEWIEMKKHPEIGYRIAKSSIELASIADYIYAHHERWDGKGYPKELKGNDIPLLARIITVVDSYDAMTEDRIYRKGISKEEAIEEIKGNSGKQFDPEIVKIFLDIVEKI